MRAGTMLRALTETGHTYRIVMTAGRIEMSATRLVGGQRFEAEALFSELPFEDTLDRVVREVCHKARI